MATSATTYRLGGTALEACQTTRELCENILSRHLCITFLI